MCSRFLYIDIVSITTYTSAFYYTKSDERLSARQLRRHETQQDMNSKVIVTLFSLFSELERDLISLRAKEVLSAKRARGQVLGKPKGTLQKSKFDQRLVRIKEFKLRAPSQQTR